MHVRSVSASVLTSPLGAPAAAAPSPPRLAPPAADRLVLDGSGLGSTGASAVSAVGSLASATSTRFPGLDACVADATAAALAGGDGPPDPTVFASLRARLEAARDRLPSEYRKAVADPLLRELDELGPRGFAKLLASDPRRAGDAGLLLDIAQSVLQPAEGYRPRQLGAFQEVVGDLYEGFLSAEARRGVKPPDHGVVAPLVRWGSADSGPYTWPADATEEYGVQAAVVSLPDANAEGGILAWPALAHETAGHDILSADDGLRVELSKAVRDSVRAAKLPDSVAAYWATRIDETASDVMGVLDMGPAAAVGLIGYFRGLNGAWGGKPVLRNAGPVDDPHPADIVRAYLAAETVRLLSFEGAAAWADRLVAEADRDLGRIRLGGVSMSPEAAKASAAAVARAIVRTPLRALEGKALGDIQDWRDQDEAVVAALRDRFHRGSTSPGPYAAGAYAAHAVAAGVYEAVEGTSTPGEAMSDMVGALAAMHRKNPDWPQPARAVAVAGDPGAAGRTAAA